jgi:SAM-dependent methyltransferase
LPKPPLIDRLKAWWEGYDLVPRPGGGGVPSKSATAAAPIARAPVAPINMPEAVSGWSAQRIAAAQLLFGEDYTWPGEAGAVEQLVNPLNLDEKMSVLELGAGLGGGARLMAKKFGTWVSALERDAGLATAGNALSTKHRMACKAPVTYADYMNLPVREKTIDAIVARQALSTVEDKDALLTKLVSLFKPAGQLLIADLTLADPSAAADPAFEAWRAGEPGPVELWDAGRLRSAVEKRGLEVRVTEDLTPAFRQQVLEGFAASADLLTDKSIDTTLKGWILWETELWARRVQMMDKGLIACHRIYATVVLKA